MMFRFISLVLCFGAVYTSAFPIEEVLRMPGMNLTTVCSALADNSFIPLGPMGGGKPMKRESEENDEEEDMLSEEEEFDDEDVEDDEGGDEVLRKKKKGGKGGPDMKQLLKFFVGECRSGSLDRIHIVKPLCKSQASFRTMDGFPIQTYCKNSTTPMPMGTMARVFSIPQSTATAFKCVHFMCNAGSTAKPTISESDDCDYNAPCESPKGGKEKGKAGKKGGKKGKGKKNGL